MWALLFAITTVISAVGWLTRYISCTAIIYYIKKKGYSLPNETEMKECTTYVVKRLFM